MSKKYKDYSEEFKLSVIRDYYSSGMSKYACMYLEPSKQL